MNAQNPSTLLTLTSLTYHVLLALADEDRHGYGIIKEVEDLTNGQMELETGTLYAAMKRMRKDQLIEVVAHTFFEPHRFTSGCRSRILKRAAV